jgi:aryl-alcohol dehydrogenase-like predicted oxidoreductase
MEYRKLGHSGVDVSALALGSWNTFELMEEGSRLAVLSAAIEAGINFLDDARYNDPTGKAPIETGYSEVIFGNLLRAGGWKREDLILANKLWFEFYPEENFEAEIDGSLSRIGIDYIDLIYCITPPDNLPAEDLVQQIAMLLETGKARYWGIANWPADLIRKCCAIAESTDATLPCAAQLPYSVIRRSPVEDEAMVAVCRDYRIGIVPSFSLEGGVLTGKYNQGGFPPTIRGKADQIAKLKQDGTLAKVDQLMAIADETGCTPGQLALAYCLTNPQTCSLLFGATTIDQVTENLAALDVAGKLTDDDRARLAAL